MKPTATFLLLAAVVSAMPFTNDERVTHDIRAVGLDELTMHQIRGHGRHPKPKDPDCDDGDGDHNGGGDGEHNGGGNGGDGGNNGGAGDTYKPCIIGQPKCCSVNVIDILGLECSTREFSPTAILPALS